jgi:hypothetical protein
MKRLALLVTALLAAAGCANPTAPRDGAAKTARAASARSQLTGATQANTSTKITAN